VFPNDKFKIRGFVQAIGRDQAALRVELLSAKAGEKEGQGETKVDAVMTADIADLGRSDDWRQRLRASISATAGNGPGTRCRKSGFPRRRLLLFAISHLVFLLVRE